MNKRVLNILEFKMTFRNTSLITLLILASACAGPLPAQAVIGDEDSTTETDDSTSPSLDVEDLGDSGGTVGTDSEDTDGTNGTDDGACAAEYVLSWEPTPYGNGRDLAYATNGDLWIADGDSLDDADSEIGSTTLLEIEVTDCDGPSQDVNGSFANSGDVPGPDWAAGRWWICSFDDLDNMGYYGTFYVNGVMVEPTVFGLDVNGDGFYTGAGGDEVGCHFDLVPDQ